MLTALPGAGWLNVIVAGEADGDGDCDGLSLGDADGVDDGEGLDDGADGDGEPGSKAPVPPVQPLRTSATATYPESCAARRWSMMSSLVKGEFYSSYALNGSVLRD